MDKTYHFRLFLAGLVELPLVFLIASSEGREWIPRRWWWVAIVVAVILYVVLVWRYVWDCVMEARQKAKMGYESRHRVVRTLKRLLRSPREQITRPLVRDHLRSTAFFVRPFVVLILTASILFGMGCVATVAYFTSQHPNLEITYIPRVTGKHTQKNEFGEDVTYWTQNVEITNHSDRNVSLAFILLVRYRSAEGGRSAVAADGEWRDDLRHATNRYIVNIERQSTANGVLLFAFQPVLTKSIEGWNEISYNKMALRIEDKVSGRMVFAAVPGIYPPELEGGFAGVE